MTRTRPLGAIVAVVAAAGGAGCGRPHPATTPAPTPAAARAPAVADSDLPAVRGFTAGPPSPGPRFVRRRYTRGGARIDVTLARTAMSSDDYARWVKQSVASFPQAALDVPASDANGFYQCSDGPPASCDLLIQLRAGVHVEIRGGGTSTRDEVDALARGLPLRALARPAAD